VAMTSRERIKKALDHQEPDRVPFDLGGTFASTVVLGAYQRLAEYLGVDDPEPVFMRLTSQTVFLHEKVLEKLGIDTRCLSLGAPDGSPEREDATGTMIDEWGVGRRKPASSLYYDLSYSPLAGSITPKDLERHPWPDPDDPGRYRGLEERARYLHEETDYAVILNLPLGMVHQAQFLRGFEDWFVDLLLDPGLAGDLMDRVNEVNKRIVANALDICGQYVDVVMYADDVATQNGPMFANETYRELIKPREKELFDLIKEKSNAKILYHCCGSVVHLLDDFIDIGVDVITPVQVSAKGMDTKWLKANYRGRLSFWGGVDTHWVLPRGTPADVKAETKRRLEDLMPGGGYVLNSVHNIQPDVPPENIVAMFEAGLEYGYY